MLRIKDRKGKKVDIVSVDSLGTASAAKGWREAVVSGPILIEEGVTVPYEDDGSRSYAGFYAQRHPRTLMGYTADGWMYFIAVDGRFPQGIGMTVDELQVLCESLGLFEALNLDGGGSTTLWTRETGVVNHPYDNKQFDHAGERAVPNVIIVK
jgi:exopolysaccharide biosynthesis protein